MENKVSLNWFLLIALTLLVAAIMLELVIILDRSVVDLAWCHENYPVDRILHCMWYENTTFGRFLQP